MNKKTIRAQLLNQRKNLDVASIESCSLKIVTKITASGLYKSANRIALYLPINGEVDLTKLLTDPDKLFYIPAIQGNSMQFQLYRANDELEVHHYGVSQPKFIETLTKPFIDLCLMPLIGFDTSGNRLGMGGGFYDRYFAKKHNTLLAGVAYEFQLIDQLPTDPWDVKLHCIFTEHKLYTL